MQEGRVGGGGGCGGGATAKASWMLSCSVLLHHGVSESEQPLLSLDDCIQNLVY